MQTNNSNGLPFFQGYTGAAGRPDRRIQHQHQAIIPTYKLNCCGNITEWGVDLNPAQANLFTFDFQVWRPSPTVNENGCYSLVDNFTVRSTSLPSGPAVNHVARVTPLPQNQLQFQPGDVLGFYVESHGAISDDDNGVVLLDNGSYTSELVWFARINIAAQPPQSGSCPYPVGTNALLGSLTHAAPVISLSIQMYSCTPNVDDVTAVHPGNGSSNTISLSVFILGVTLPVIVLVGVTVTATVLITVLIRKTSRCRSTGGSNNMCNDQEYVYVSPAVNAAHSIQLKPNVAYATHSSKSSCSTVVI